MTIDELLKEQSRSLRLIEKGMCCLTTAIENISSGGGGGSGTPGSVWRDGAGVPSNGLGVDGDFYLRTTNGDVYTKASGSYTVTANIKGATGTAGAAGAAGSNGTNGTNGTNGSNGANGADGTVFRSGSGVPSNGLGINGDFYLDTVTGNIYLKAAGAYSINANIKGPTGATGPTGPTGNDGHGFIDQTPASGTAGTLAGVVNGSNTVFTVSQLQYTSGSLIVQLNGQTQVNGDDWNETSPASGTFTFTTAPPTGSVIIAIYGLATVGVGTVSSVATGTGLAGGTITATGTITLNTTLQPMATMATNGGKFLRVNAGETAVEYATISGTGTVTATGGNLTSNSIVLGAGGVDTKVVTGITSDGTSKLTLGIAGTSIGSVDFKNATSGTITLAPITGALGSVSLLMPAISDTIVTKTSTDVLTNKTSINGLAITNTSSATLSISSGKSLSIGNVLALAGVDATTITFQGTDTYIGRGTTDTLTNKTLTSANITTKLLPTTDDGAPLGDTTHNFSDLFLATGAVINYQNGNVALTHSSGVLTLGTGDLRITTAGTNSASVVTVGGTQTLTNKTLTSPVISTISNTGTVTLPTATDTLVARATTDTLTNKRITKRTGTTASSATPTINTDNVDFYSLTAQAADITSFTSNLSGTPTEGQTLWIAITGTAARAITWGTSFESSTVTLPTTTVTTARLDVGFVFNTVSSKWRCVATC